jgi:ATP-dependent Lon protease
LAKDDEANLFDQLPGGDLAVATDLVSVVLPSAPTFRDMDKGVRAIIGKPLPFVVSGKLVEAREKLVARHPHAAAIIGSLLSEAREGRPIRLRPTLLLGAPGVGKSLLARELLGAFGIPFAIIDAGTCSDHAITGSARRWSESYPSLPLRLWSEHHVANPAIIVDELEKAGRSSAGSLHDPLLGLLERGSSERWRDHHIDSEVNASGLNWLMTANSLAGIPPALLSRLRVLRVPLPKREYVPSLAASLRLQILQERNVDPAIEPPLAPDEIEAIAGAFGAEGSIRDLQRYVAGILDGRAVIAARN